MSLKTSRRNPYLGLFVINCLLSVTTFASTLSVAILLFTNKHSLAEGKSQEVSKEEQENTETKIESSSSSTGDSVSTKSSPQNNKPEFSNSSETVKGKKSDTSSSPKRDSVSTKSSPQNNKPEFSNSSVEQTKGAQKSDSPSQAQAKPTGMPSYPSFSTSTQGIQLIPPPTVSPPSNTPNLPSNSREIPYFKQTQTNVANHSESETDSAEAPAPSQTQENLPTPPSSIQVREQIGQLISYRAADLGATQSVDTAPAEEKASEPSRLEDEERHILKQEAVSPEDIRRFAGLKMYPGMKAQARLLTPIAINTANQDVLLILDQDLADAEEGIVLPKGTVLVATAQNQGTTISINPSAYFDANGTQKKLPEDSIRVLLPTGLPVSVTTAVRSNRNQGISLERILITTGKEILNEVIGIDNSLVNGLIGGFGETLIQELLPTESQGIGLESNYITGNTPLLVMVVKGVTLE